MTIPRFTLVRFPLGLYQTVASYCYCLCSPAIPQLWELALVRNLGEQLSATTLILGGNHFGAQIWTIAALGQPLCRNASG